ncbi:MAG: anaerobic ribonucleoside-triphosphate reductase activating protein [Bacillota bacterium]
MKIRVSGFSRESIVDGPGIRAVVYAQGCPHQCPHCHNPSTWDFEGGYELDIEEIVGLVKETGLLRGVTLSGGEPFLQAESFAELAGRVKSLGLDVVTYTGYTFEELLKMGQKDPSVDRLLHCTDILVDGPYRHEERDLALAFRGSRNQRIIDVRKSLQEGQVITLDF